MIDVQAAPGAAGEPMLARPARLALAAVSCALAVAIIAGWLVLAAFHLDDDYRVSHVQGIWLAAADAARDGQLYPPVFDGERYAGTRYLPLPILLNALAGHLAGDDLVGGKALAVALMATLLGLVLLLLRRSSCPWPVALALTAGIVATDTGLQAGTTVGGDLLPVVLQTGALAAAVHGAGARYMLLAGTLAGLAIASKLTGVWAFLAIGTWLVLQRQSRPLVLFTASCLCSAAAVLGAVEVVTRGGLSEHLLTFAFAGVEGAGSFWRSPNQLLYNLLDHAWGAVVLLPLAALGGMLVRRAVDVSPAHLALAYAVMLLLVVYADVGTGSNQLIDLVVVTALAAGVVAGGAVLRNGRGASSALAAAVAVTVTWSASLDLVRTVAFDVRAAIAASRQETPPVRSAAAVARIVQPGEEVLAEDPSIDVALNRRPVIMDPFMFTRLERRRPDAIDPLLSRITAREFDLVVLVVPLEDRGLDYWWKDFHFGERVARALRANYQAAGTVSRYFLYRPLP